MSKKFIIALATIAAAVLAVGIPNFIKARQTTAANYYVNNLRQFEAAKQQWALEGGKTTNDSSPKWVELLPYLASGYTNYHATNGVVVGPKGEIYTLGRVGQPASSFVDGHMIYGD